MSVDVQNDFGKTINLVSVILTILFITYLGYSLQEFLKFSSNAQELFVTAIAILAIMWSATPQVTITRIISYNFSIIRKIIWLVLQLGCAWSLMYYAYDNLNFHQLEILDYILILAAPTLQYIAIRIVGMFMNISS